MQTLFPSFSDFTSRKDHIAVVGLGYVGLPLALALADRFSVIGFDISRERIAELQSGHDRTGEADPVLLGKNSMRFSSDPADLGLAKLIIVAVPTPIDAHRNPDLGPVKGASSTVGKHMQRGTVVVYESTVYPGVTEEICVPVLEAESGLRYGSDFEVGYSPERINPGDKVHTVDKIVKVVAAGSVEMRDLLASVYGSVITAGIHKAPSIKVAEAAKVIENTQRDLNIALMNELSLIFDRLGIDTLDALTAAGTKWNFLPFRPGLVGGHCIGVDPYYLTYKAEEAGYHPEVILAGRRINDDMGKHVARQTVKMLIKAGCRVDEARVGIFGFTFKENVPDLRNTRVIDIKAELEEYGVAVAVHDPMADAAEAEHEYGLTLSPLEAMRDLDAAIFAVAHDAYTRMALPDVRKRFGQHGCAVLVDLKGLWNKARAEDAGMAYWRL